MFHYYQFGAYDENSCARFSVFFPGPQDYSRGGDPHIKELKVFGTFQPALGHSAWSEADALKLEPSAFEGGTLYQGTTSRLSDGFYEYKYIVVFDNDERRLVGDPCARYGSGQDDNSGFVIGGSLPSANIVTPLASRLEPSDLIIYEMMIHDFTKEYHGSRAPVDAVIDKLDYIRDLGFNAIEFMPWTAWPGNEFSWGYDPFMYFAVEYGYTHFPLEPAEKLSRLKRLISECHQRGLHVIMDGVFNHVQKGREGFGFAYYWLYKNASDCPFIGQFGDGGFNLDEIDFRNACTAQFILDVCRYWIDVFGVDGLRLDYTKGFYLGGNTGPGLPDLIDGIRKHIETKGDDFKQKFPIIIEHIEGYQAIDVANKVNATSCWYDEMIWRTRGYLYGWRIDERIMRLLDTARDFGPGRVPITYVENHDHTEIAAVASGAYQCEFDRDQWYRAQPYLIALLTCFGAPLLYNGQEFADGYAMPEGCEETRFCFRIHPRPKHWALSEDTIGRWMRKLVQMLIRIRKEHPALRSPNFYPQNWESWMQKPSLDGFGVDVEKGTVVYQRWGQASDGKLERLIIALNFSAVTQTIDIPLPSGGVWEDLLSGWRVAPTTGDKLRQQGVSGNWGYIFYKG